MTTDLRLALRLMRGGGVGGFVRLGLMTFGFGFGMTVVLFLATMPAVLHERGRITAARQPITTDLTPGFRSSINFGSWEGQRFTRVLIAAAAPDAPPPPGVTRLPAAGETVLSPAASRLARQDANFAEMVRGREVGQVKPAGLLGPDELYAYVGVKPEDLPSASPGRSWGGFAVDEEMRRQFSDVPLQLLLIVSAPALIYFSVCSRLSATTRRRRYGALRLVGMDRGRLLRISALESGAAALLGGVLGLVGYKWLNSIVGPSGALGFTWFPRASALSPGLAAFALAVFVSVASLVGGATTARAIIRPIQARTESADRPPRWWYVAPLLFGLGLITYPLLEVNGEPRGAMDPVGGGLLLFGVALAAIGLLLSLRPGLVGLARVVAVSRLPLAVRLAARRVEYESAGIARHLAGLCALVLVASIGASVLRQTELSATPSAERLIVKINGQDVPVSARDELGRLPADATWLQQRSVTSLPPLGTAPTTIEDFVQIQGVTLLVADCAALRRNTGQALENCQNGDRYRVQPSNPQLRLPAGLPVRFLGADGSETVIETPEKVIDLSHGDGLPQDMAILVAGETTPIGITENTIVFYQLQSKILPIDRFATQLARVAPAATMSVFGLDLEALETYRVHRGVVGMGVLLAFALGICAFLISAVSRAVERRRQVTSLVVVGTSKRILRHVQLTQILAPLALALATSVGVGHLGGNALLRLQGRQVGWFTGTLSAAWPMAIFALLAATLAGFIVVGLKPKAEDLRRE